jgi:NAD(P)-dependent dehydrogenase (short-subunit alcohol dehydrogenase family)
MPSLNDCVVLLTVGATGIGRAIALDMAARGRPSRLAIRTSMAARNC